MLMDVMPCSLLDRCQRFRGTSCRHVQGRVPQTAGDFLTSQELFCAKLKFLFCFGKIPYLDPFLRQFTLSFYILFLRDPF